MNEVIQAMPDKIGVFVFGFITALGVLLTAIKTFKVKGISLNVGAPKTGEGNGKCLHHEGIVKEQKVLWDKYDDMHKELSDTRADMAEVKTDVKWLRNKHDGYSAQDILGKILNKIEEKNG